MEITAFTGSKTITPNMVGISNWYRAYGYRVNEGGGPDARWLNPSDMSTFALHRYCTTLQKFGGVAKWSWIEKLKGQYDYDQMLIDDLYTKYWKDLGKSILTEIGYTPAWANNNIRYKEGGISYSASQTPNTCSIGSKEVGIDTYSTAWNYDGNLLHRYRFTMISAGTPSAKMSGFANRTTASGVKHLTIGAGTGATSGIWGTTGGTGTGATGTFTETAGVITSYTVTNAGTGYTTGHSVVATSGSLGTNVLTASIGHSVRFETDAIEGSGTYSDWRLYVDAGNMAPTNMADFADWCQFIGERNERPFTTAGAVDCGWGGAVRYWFVRNEPACEITSHGGGQYFRDTPQKYAEMIRVANQILKKINPLNKIIGCDAAYPSNPHTLLAYKCSTGSSGSTIVLQTPTKNNINGAFVVGSGMAKGARVVSGQGTNTLVLDKVHTFNPANNADMNLKLPQGLSSTKEILTASAAGFDTAPYGVTGNTTGAGTLAHEWVDIISSHGYVGKAEDSVDSHSHIYYEWVKFRAMLAEIGVTKPVWQTEYQFVPTGGLAAPYQFADELVEMKRSFIAAWLVGLVELSIWFGWGLNAATWNQNDAAGVAARNEWNSFMNTMFASPIVSCTFNTVSRRWTVTQANATVTVI